MLPAGRRCEGLLFHDPHAKHTCFRMGSWVLISAPRAASMPIIAPLRCEYKKSVRRKNILWSAASHMVKHRPSKLQVQSEKDLGRNETLW